MMNEEKQILIGSILGDGHIKPNGVFSTGSKYKEWVDYKCKVLDRFKVTYKFVKENGFAKNPYHTMCTRVHKDIMSLTMLLKHLNI